MGGPPQPAASSQQQPMGREWRGHEASLGLFDPHVQYPTGIPSVRTVSCSGGHVTGLRVKLGHGAISTASQRAVPRQHAELRSTPKNSTSPTCCPPALSATSIHQSTQHSCPSSTPSLLPLAHQTPRQSTTINSVVLAQHRIVEIKNQLSHSPVVAAMASEGPV